MKIRPAHRDEILALASLYSRGPSYGAAYFKTCAARQEAGELKVYLACQAGDDDFVGAVILNFAPKYSFYKRLGIPEIQDLYVSSDYRRQGIASALIKHCEVVHRENGGQEIGISVPVTSRYGPAQRLYSSLGYMPDGNGVTYDRRPVSTGEIMPIDDEMCLMMVKSLI